MMAIYEIRCTVNGRRYVGKSEDVVKRFQTHFNLLSKNKHDNEELQNDYNLHGLSYFTFKVIQFVAVLKDLNYLEAQFIKYLDDNLDYNVAGLKTTTIKLYNNINQRKVVDMDNFNLSGYLKTRAKRLTTVKVLCEDIKIMYGVRLEPRVVGKQLRKLGIKPLPTKRKGCSVYKI